MAGAGRFRRRWADGPWLTGGYRRRMWPGPQDAASGGGVQRQQLGLGLGHLRAQRGLAGAQLRGIRAAIGRSEEHTSETPVTNAHLVFRLLLEKKNIHTRSPTYQQHN